MRAKDELPFRFDDFDIAQDVTWEGLRREIGRANRRASRPQRTPDQILQDMVRLLSGLKESQKAVVLGGRLGRMGA